MFFFFHIDAFQFYVNQNFISELISNYILCNLYFKL